MGSHSGSAMPCHWNGHPAALEFPAMGMYAPLRAGEVGLAQNRGTNSKEPSIQTYFYSEHIVLECKSFIFRGQSTNKMSDFMSNLFLGKLFCFEKLQCPRPEIQLGHSYLGKSMEIGSWSSQHVILST